MLWGDISGRANKPPSAAFTYAPTNPNVGEQVSFTDDSTDPNNNIESWEWDFGDGTTATVQNPTHSYAVSGTVTVTLTVTDAGGITDSTSQTFDVLPAGVSTIDYENQTWGAWTNIGSGNDAGLAITTDAVAGAYGGTGSNANRLKASLEGTSTDAYSEISVWVKHAGESHNNVHIYTNDSDTTNTRSGGTGLVYTYQGDTARIDYFSGGNWSDRLIWIGDNDLGFEGYGQWVKMCCRRWAGGPIEMWFEDVDGTTLHDTGQLSTGHEGNIGAGGVTFEMDGGHSIDNWYFDTRTP